MAALEQNHRFVVHPGARRYILWVALALCIPFLTSLFINHQARSEWEKRRLADPPSASQLEDLRGYFNQWAQFIDDHLAFFVTSNRAYRKFLYRVLADNPVANVSVTGSGALFLNGWQTDKPNEFIAGACRGPAPRRVTQQSRRAMQCISDFLAQRRVSTTFGFAPLKATIYPELLPESLPHRLREQCRAFPARGTLAADLIAGRGPENTRVWFPLEEFKVLKNRPNFYPLDSFHWAGDSAFVFAQGMLALSLADKYEPVPYQRELIDGRSDFSFVGFDIPTRYWQYRYPDHPLSGQEIGKDISSGLRQAIRYENVQSDFPHHGLLLSDSFGSGLVEHLVPVFASLTHLDYVNIRPSEYDALVQYLVNLTPLTHVMLLHQARVLPGVVRIRRLARAIGAHSSARGQSIAACDHTVGSNNQDKIDRHR